MYNIADYGAVRDSGVLATRAIEAAIAAASEAGEARWWFRPARS